MTQVLEGQFTKDAYIPTDWRSRELAEFGDYRRRWCIWRRLGTSTTFAGRWRFTGNCTLTITALAVQVE